jgi:hypothetical protein
MSRRRPGVLPAPVHRSCDRAVAGTHASVHALEDISPRPHGRSYSKQILSPVPGATESAAFVAAVWWRRFTVSRFSVPGLNSLLQLLGAGRCC